MAPADNSAGAFAFWEHCGPGVMEPSQQAIYVGSVIAQKDMLMSRFVMAFAVGLACASTSSYAGARCDGDFELVRGSWVSTRYCRAAQIASVAREVGIRVSPETIMRSPAKADEVCRFIGSDIRVQPACDQVTSRFQLSF
jgi:hypothetical protein